ncbi:MAG: secondary thiamine-phosphate synthase enzyme YjbQ [Candidatus Omnitrophota bacterium]
MKTFNVKTQKRQELIDITRQVRDIVAKEGVEDGLCLVFVPHTTAGVTINENADPSVRSDIIKGLEMVPEGGYDHSEGNSPAHIKASIVGSSVYIIIKDGEPKLGTWQGIYFAEFDGPRHRSVWVKTVNSRM